MRDVEHTKSVSSCLLCCLLALLLVISNISIAYASVVSSGHNTNCKNNVDWTLDSDGNYLIGKDGENQVIDFSNLFESEDHFWAYNSDIKTIRFAGTVDITGDGSDNTEAYWDDEFHDTFSNWFDDDTSGSLKSIDFTNANVRRATNLSNMFYTYGVADGRALEEIIFGDNFDTSATVDVNGMFAGCHNLKNLSFGEKTTFSSLSDFSSMFEGLRSVEKLDISMFNTSNATSMSRMFDGMTSLRSVSFGENFTTWIDNAYLPTPTGSNLTGKWINKDKPELGAKTSQELYNELPKAAAVYSGEWVAQTRGDIISDMINTIEYVSVSIDGKDISPEEYWTTQEARNDIDSAVTEALTIVALNSVDTDWDKAESDISTSISKYDSEKKPGTKSNESASNTGDGSTDLLIELITKEEKGGTEDPNNPDEDGDGLGDVISFTVPTKVDFVAKSNGELIAPSASTTFIENESEFNVFVSSLYSNPGEGWHIVGDATEVENDGTIDTENNVSIEITPVSGDKKQKINIVDFIEKHYLPGFDWNMTYKIDSDAIVSDRVQMQFNGAVSVVKKDLTKADKFAELHWYVTPDQHI